MKQNKDAYLDWLDYKCIGHRRGIENMHLYRPEYLRRYLDKEYAIWVDNSPFELVRSQHIG